MPHDSIKMGLETFSVSSPEPAPNEMEAVTARLKLPRRRVVWIPYAILAVGLMTTIIATLYIAQTAQIRDELRFTNLTAQTRSSIQARLNTYTSLLYGGAGLFAASHDVTRSEFRDYVSRLNLRTSYPGVRGLGFATRVTKGTEKDLIATMKRQGVSDFHLWSAPQNPPAFSEVKTSIIYLEPGDRRNHVAIGFDMMSEPTRREAMLKARDTGRAAATGKVLLVQEITAQKQPGFLIYVPVYNGDPKTITERQRQISGFLYSGFRTGDLFYNIVPDSTFSRLNMRVYDTDEFTEDHLMFRSDNDAKAAAQNQASGHTSSEPPLVSREVIQIAGRKWGLEFTSGPQFEHTFSGEAAHWVLYSGLLLSLLLWSITRAQVKAQESSEQSAFELLQSQQELLRSQDALRTSETRARRLIESNLLGVTVASLDGRIIEANDAFLKIINYTREDVLESRLDLRSLTPPEWEDIDRRAFQELLDTGSNTPYEKEFIRRDGVRIPVLVGTATVHDDKQQPQDVGFILDLSERKRDERRREAQYTVTRILAEAASLEAAAPRLLKTICKSLGWQFGALWLIERDNTYNSTKLDSGVLHCVQTWRVPEVNCREFEAATRSAKFHVGEELPGLIWASAEPIYYADLAEHTADPSLPLAPLAQREGLHAACGFPIILGQSSYGAEVLGVIEFFSHEIRNPDRDLQEMMAAVGSQIGQFVVRRRAEAASRESAERLKLALAGARIGDWEWNAATDALHLSPRVQEILGIKRDTPLTFHELLHIVHPDDRARVIAEVNRAVEDKIDHDVEYRVVWPDGSVHWVAAIGRVFYNEGGTPLRMLGVMLDINERKRAEEERTNLLERERTARQEAEAANRMKDEFLATLSHELRTPLNSILGWSYLLLEGRLPVDQQSQGVEAIHRNANTQARLIEDLLDMSRIISGKLRLDIQKVFPAPILRAALDAIRPSADAKQITLQADIPTSTSAIEADPVRLQQITWNLLSNAVKFTPEDGWVKLQLREQDGHIQLCVSDNGVGISPEFIPHIFDRFRQADSSSTRQHGGLGLGLSIVHHLVERHGGTVRVESDGPNQGSTFIVELPTTDIGPYPNYEEQDSPEEQETLKTEDVSPVQTGDDTTTKESEAEATPAPAPVSASAGEQEPVKVEGHLNGKDETRRPLTGIRILVVEDEEDTREMLSLVLGRRGAQMHAVESAQQALQSVHTWLPDVLISDIGLPDQDGYSLMQEIRALDDQRIATVPAVALTAFASNEDKRKAAEAGFQEHLSKPVALDEFVAVVTHLAGRETSETSP